MAYTIIDDMYEGKYIQTCTPELALSVGLDLRREDRREAEETSGLCAEASIIESFYNSAYSVYFKVPNGKAAGVAGVNPPPIIYFSFSHLPTPQRAPDLVCRPFLLKKKKKKKKVNYQFCSRSL